MNTFLKNFIYIFAFIIFVILCEGCVNVIQKFKINEDGSGTVTIRYWTKSIKISKDELSGFGFTEEKVKNNYISSNSEPNNIKIEKNVTNDSLSVVTLNVMFKDINKLSLAIAFKNIKSKYVHNKENIHFEYNVLRDTSYGDEPEMNKYILYYEFEFPYKVINSNGTASADGKLIYWKYSVSNLINDIILYATINGK